MKKEFSFYEFVGILVPSVIFLFATNLIISNVYQKQVFDFSKIGESFVFIIIAYGFGHLLQALGNFFESLFWGVFKGMPTKWLTNKNLFGKNLFDSTLNSKIEAKVKLKFGEGIEDYGRITNNILIQKNLNARIEIFNGNYSLFRGLAVSFLLISIMCSIYFDYTIVSPFIIFFLLAVWRMHRFALYYAKEVFMTFYNLPE